MNMFKKSKPPNKIKRTVFFQLISHIADFPHVEFLESIKKKANKLIEKRG